MEEEEKERKRRRSRKRRRKKRRDVASKEALSPRELCQPMHWAGGFCWFVLPTVESGFLTQTHVFIAKEFFWPKGSFFLTEKKIGEVGGKGRFCKISFFLKNSPN